MKHQHKNHVDERTTKPLAERYVSMSNALARSAQGLLLSEKRVVAMSLAKTDSMQFQDAVRAQAHYRNGWSVRLTATEYAKEFGITNDAAYQQLKEAATHLRGRFVRQIVETPRGPKEIETNWCEQCTYHPGEGWVEVAFTSKIAPHLLGLRAKFVSYKLKQVTAMRSNYSWRLFECLQSWSDTGRWIVDTEAFYYAMEVPPGLSDFAQVRRRVINPAVKELREKNGLEVNLELKTSGRKVIQLIFTFRSNPQTNLFSTEEMTG